MKNRRRLWIVLATVCTFLICAGLCVGLILHRESELDDIQNEALEELRDHRGEYDEKSIVLYDTNRGEAQALAEKFEAELRISFDGKFATLTLPGDVTVEDIYSARGNRKYIADMALDYQVKTSEITDAEEEGNGERLPTRPQYSVSDEDYALQGYLDYLNMKNVWGWTTGYNVTVAVIDTGIDTDHPEFAGRISEYSYNATEDKIVKDYLLEDGSYDWSLVEDEQGHGTAVTGVIAASMNEGKVVGIAPSVTIITIKAECDENGRFARTSDLVFGLYYAIERDVDVVNMSFGVQSLINPFAEATQLALDSDVICVAAAGNEGTASLSYPAADPNVFGVGALEADGWNLASYSNYGENVNLVAPGTTYTTLMEGKYGTMNGTSLASPVVTGAIALYLSANRYQEFLTVEEVLYASCYDLGDLGCDYYYGYGALDISALIMEERGTVTFNMMTDELENTEQLFIRDHTLQNMPEPERLYAIFDGWYYDPYGTEEYNWYTDKFSTDLTLYAKWVNEEDGIPFTYVELEDGTIEIRSYTGHRRYITIPDMIDGKIVSSIGEEAFKGETRLREVILPKELKRIRRSAFEGCNNLVHIDLPDTVVEIGEKAFFNNVRLSYVGIGGSSQLASIGNFAFSNCAKLQRFELPASVVSVNGSAFYGATNLTAFTVRAGNKNFTAKDGVLFNYTQSTLVAYPAGMREEYTIPATVLTIGDYSFGYMRFAGINLGNVQTIGNFAFANSELESIVIPDTVTAMGVSAFEKNFYLQSVQLGNGLTAISKYVFYYCTALEQIEIPANIREIQQGAFANTLGMTSVTFASNSKLTAIGKSAFASSSLSSVAIPASVISIGDAAFAQHFLAPLASVTFAEDSQLRTIGGEAFKGTYRLTAIDLPEQLTSLGAFAFMGSGLEQVTIPASLTSFGAGAFAACHSLTAITVEEANTVYTDVDGVVYDKAKTTLIEYPAGNTRSDYTVLNTVTALKEDAFYGSWNLYTVYLPESLQEIRREAFFDCQGLNYIQIPDNVIQISNHAFAQCWNLTSVYLNDTSKLPRISYEAFAYCGLQSFRVPANVSTMAQGAFTGCYNLTSFTFAANSKLESISAYMFDGCDNLQSITFEEGSALTSIQAHGLEGMRKLTSVDFGDAKITNIDNFAFRFCESLTRVDLPEGVTEIGRYAFYYCTSLNEVSIPKSVEFIGRFAFLGTQNLNVYFASETLPAYLQEDWDYGTAGYYLGVTDVITDGDWKYARLTSGGIAIIQYNGTETNIDLTKLNLGSDIVNIGGKAFAYSTVESIVLPETLVTIQNEAFYHSALKAISIPASVDFIGRSAFADTPIETLTFASNAKLRVMEQSAFEGTKSLGSVTLPKSLTTIGRAIFKNSGITSLTFENGIGITEISEEAFAYTNITTVTTPDSVTLLNHSAFRETKQLKAVDFGNSEGMMIMSNVFYHSGLESVHIPTNVTYVGEYAFVALTNLQNFTVDADHPQYRAIDGLLVTKDGRKLIAAPAGREGTLTVPAGIEVIGFGAFEESKLTKINFLDDANILSFGYRAFYGSAITEMHVPASVVAIDYYAFATCENLTKVTFAEDNQLRGIYEGAFYACPNLYDVTLPDAIVEISDFAFYGCKKIDKLPISNTSTIKGIYDYAFAYTGLDGDFTTPETLIDIGAYAFMGNKFTSVTVPDTNAYDLVIGIGAFEECNNLEEITLPFIGASFEDPDYTWFGYIFGAGGYEANSTYVPDSLKKVTITEGISFVGTGAFWCIDTIEEIDVPHSVTFLYDYAFGGTVAKYELTNTISVEENRLRSWGRSDKYYYMPYFGHGISGNLKLAEGIISIGSEAFHSCASLMSIEIPSSVTEIAYAAFDNCQSFTSIKIPSSVTTIGDYAFSACTSLTSIEIPSSVTTIGSYVFQVCERLTSIEIPLGVTSIGYGAFSGCTSLASIEIPSSVTSIAQYAFAGCTGLMSVHITDLTSWCVTEFDPFSANPLSYGGNLYLNDKLVTELVIPEGITSIGVGTFQGCTSLTSVEIPSSVTEIGNYAFEGCTSLHQVVNHSNLTLTLGSSDNGYLTYYAKLIINRDGSKTYITEDSDFTYIDTADGFLFTCENGTYRLITYFGGENTVTLPTDINGKPYEIYKMTGVENVIIPSGVTSIGNYAFEDCKSLRSIEIPSSVTSIGDYAFGGCVSLTSVGIPSSVTTIGDYAFSNCTSLAGIEIPYGVTLIGQYVFSDCVSLTSVEIPSSMTSIEDHAFSGCWSLTNIEIPSSVTAIGSEAFRECKSLTNIEIPSSVTSLGSGAFVWCANLTNVTFGENSQLSTIGPGVFSYCTSLTSIEIPSSVTSIEINAFNCCTGLTSIEIPASVISIGFEVFYECTSLTNVTFEENSHLTTIEPCAFSGCTRLKSVTFGKNSQLPAIGPSAFSYCTGLVSIEIPSSVTEIGDNAFSNCKSLTSIKISSSVTKIGGSAFSECTSLTNVIFEENSHLITIGAGAFGSCRSLANIKIPASVNSIDMYAFSDCTSLTSIEIPSGVDFIGRCAFSGCPITKFVVDEANEHFTVIDNVVYNKDITAIVVVPEAVTKFVIPKTVTDISWAFYGNKNIQFISFEAGTVITSIGDCAFSHCMSLTSIEIPSSVTSIGTEALLGCTSLTSIEIPSSMTSIGTDAFLGCTGLYQVVNHSNLVLTIGSSDNGYLACYAKLIINKDGSKTYKADESGIAYIDTADGFLFACENGKYRLIAYLGGESTVTLPTDINGNPYEIYRMRGVINVIIPSGMTSIGNYAFEGCKSLRSIKLTSSVTGISSTAFNDIAYYNDPYKWENGALCIGDLLIKVREDVEYLVRPEIKFIVEDALEGCYKLKHLTIGGENAGILSDLTNLETLIITEMPGRVIDYFGGVENLPITLKNIVLVDGVGMNSNAFRGITGITIYVEADEKDVRWDENFPGWNAGNRVVYGDRWINTTFYDTNGNIVFREIFTTSQVIRLPQIPLPEAEEGYVFVVDGWDLDGDGIADVIPATSTIDINAHPIIKKEQKTYKIVFYAEDGKTVIASFNLAHGAAITPPEVVDKQGYITNGWIGYYEGLTATRNREYILNRSHIGGDHTYGEPVWVAPTCTEKGYNKHTCTVCGEWYTTDEVEPLGHSYTETRQEPDCLTDGSVTYHCNTCGDEYTEILPAEGHAYTSKLIKDSTCTKLGEMQFTCTVCGDKQTEPIALKAHDYQKKYASKWWFQWLIEHILNIFFGYEGSNPYYFECVDCGHIQTAAESAGSGSASVKDVCEHQLSDWTLINEASCAGYATEGRICSICDQVVEARTSGELGEHISSEAVVENRVEPDCENNGSYDSVVYCSICKEKLSREAKVIAKLGHTNAIPVVENRIEATCTTDGSYDSVTYCSVCQAEIYRETKVIAKLGHNQSIEWIVDVKPTCITAGSMSHHCTRCDDKADVTEISATGHTFGNWTQTQAPTCTEKGSERRECANCDRFEERQVDALGHNDTSIVTSPTCTEKGYTTHGCTRCNEGKYVDSYVDALGHSFTNYVSNNDATYTEDGTKTAKCDRCNEKNTITDEGSALGMAQKFRDEMAELSQNADTETTYGELYAVLQTYTSLSAKEKEDVAKEFATLQQMINAYNTKAQTANNELADATEIAFGPIAATSFTFLAALWFLLRKKFLV